MEWYEFLIDVVQFFGIWYLIWAIGELSDAIKSILKVLK